MAFPATANNLGAAHASGQVITSANQNAVEVDVDQLTLKAGTGTSTPVAGTVLTGTGTGTSAWQAPASGGSGVAVENQGGSSLGTANTLNFTGAGVTATYSGGVGTVSISGSGAGSQTVWSYNVVDYGLVGDGVTDNTGTLSTLLNTTIGTKPAILVFPAQYQGNPAKFVIGSVTMPAAADLTFWGYGSTLLHKANASGHMLIGAGGLSSAPLRLTILGLTLDGNYTNQTTTRNRTLISTWLQLGATFRDVLFTHWSRHALEVIEATQNVVVDNCKFIDGGEWSNTATGSGPGNDNTAVTLNNQAKRYNALFTRCQFMQTSVTTAGASPGGINVAGTTDNTQPLIVTVDGCHFTNTGLRSIVGGNATSAQTASGVYFYRVGDGSKVINSTWTNPYFTCVAVTTSADVVVANNTVFANNLLSASGGGYGFSVQGDDHQNTLTLNGPNTVKRVIFHDNTLTYRAINGGTSAPATQAFYVDSVSGSHMVSEINIHDNNVDDFSIGLQLLQSTGSVSIHHNTFRSLAANGIQITDTISGHLEIQSNKFLTTAFAPITFGNQSFSSLELAVKDNYFENTSSGLTLMGNRVQLMGNTWVGTPSSAPIATLGQSGNSVGVAIVSGNMSSIAAPIVHTNCTTYIQLANTNQGNWT